MKELNIILIRCPQPLLVGEETKAMYSPNRSLTPEPTLPLLTGIIAHYAKRTNTTIKVTQLDLRDSINGKIETVHYGNLVLPYINEKINKVYNGVNVESLINLFDTADIIGFTNNFAMSRRVVCDHISKIRNLFPKIEIWLGGRDLYTNRVKNIYARATGGDCIIFNGHVFESLPAY